MSPLELIRLDLDRPHFYKLVGRDAVPVTEADWAKSFGQNRQLALDVFEPLLGKPVEVSTVFLGLDHNFGDGPPVLFETMTFGEGPSWQDRCSTYDEAEVMHANMCSRVREYISIKARLKRLLAKLFVPMSGSRGEDV